ncbi:MAG TPA: rRNA maturation RNase YbeY [Polyangiaceae bacterium]|nr:rRNA maturation RNase YbeY [Polyangiaceae bacterium]
MPTLVTRKRNLKQSVASGVVRQLGNAMLHALELEAVELSLLLTDDAGIRTLNREHRRKDKPTDVLAFPMAEGRPDRHGLLGDVVISLETAQRQADARRRSLPEEVRFLLAHGLLHLVGYDHGTRAEKREMVRMTRRLVRAAALPEGVVRRPTHPRKLAQGSKK